MLPSKHCICFYTLHTHTSKTSVAENEGLPDMPCRSCSFLPFSSGLCARKEIQNYTNCVRSCFVLYSVEYVTSIEIISQEEGKVMCLTLHAVIYMDTGSRVCDCLYIQYI